MTKPGAYSYRGLGVGEGVMSPFSNSGNLRVSSLREWEQDQIATARLREEMAWSLTSQIVPAASVRAARPCKALPPAAQLQWVTNAPMRNHLGESEPPASPYPVLNLQAGSSTSRFEDPHSWLCLPPWDSDSRVRMKIKIGGYQVGLDCKLGENRIKTLLLSEEIFPVSFKVFNSYFPPHFLDKPWIQESPHILEQWYFLSWKMKPQGY